MTLNLIDYFGLFAAFLTTVSFLPQVITTWKTKQTKDISLLMFLIFTFGVGCWTIYGLIKETLPIIISSGITFVLSLSILIAKLRYK